MLPFITGFDDVQVGQHYVYAAALGARVDEEVLAIAPESFTFRITTYTASGTPNSVQRIIPREVVWFIKKYVPERGLDSFGTNGYDATYYHAQLAASGSNFGLLANELKGHERLRISGQTFECANYGGTVLARTDHGCVQMTWRKVVADRFPFTLRATSNGKPLLTLLTIR
jgi:hypothetical protein